MRHQFLKKTSILFIGASFLAACGGGGGGGTTSAFSLFGRSITYPSTFPADGIAYEGEYTYNPATETITSVEVATEASNPRISLTYNSSGALSAATIRTATQIQSYDRIEGNNDSVLWGAFKTTQSLDGALLINPIASDVDWKYQAFGFWDDSPPSLSTPGRYGSISVGSETAGSGIPSVGSATFSGAGGGFYADSSNVTYFVLSAVSATADFATRSVDFQSTETMTLRSGTSSAVADSSLNLSGTLSYSPNTNSMTGNLTTPSGLRGSSKARFYGPNAEEIGGVFNLTGSSGQKFVGAFGAK